MTDLGAIDSRSISATVHGVQDLVLSVLAVVNVKGSSIILKKL